MYQLPKDFIPLLKDFQVLAAALIALIAALILFLSMQWTAKAQARASRDAIEIQHRMEFEEHVVREQVEQRAFAILLDQFVAGFAHRMASHAAVFRDIYEIKTEGSAHDRAGIDGLAIAMGWIQEDLRDDQMASIDWKDVAAFDPALQKLFYEVRNWVNRSWALHASLLAALRTEEVGDSARERIIALESGKGALAAIRERLRPFTILPPDPRSEV